MFTFFLAYLLCGLAQSGRLRLLRHHVHIICWGIPFILVMLRLTTNTFGVESELEYQAVCTYGGKNEYSGFMWDAITFSGLLFLLCILMIYMLAEVHYLQRSRTELANSITFTIAKETLFWYPVLLIICWAPYCLYRVWKGPHPQALSTANSTTFDIFLRSLKNLCGCFTSIMFFWKCKEAQNRWYGYFSSVFFPKFAARQAANDQQNEHEQGHGHPYPEANEDVAIEDLDSNDEMPRDSAMVRNILSVKLTSATIAAAVQLAGGLDLSDGAIGSATVGTDSLPASDSGSSNQASSNQQQHHYVVSEVSVL